MNDDWALSFCYATPARIRSLTVQQDPSMAQMFYDPLAGGLTMMASRTVGYHRCDYNKSIRSIARNFSECVRRAPWIPRELIKRISLPFHHQRIIWKWDP